MTKITLFGENLRRVAAYVCLGAGVLSIAQMPIISITEVYANEGDAALDANTDAGQVDPAGENQTSDDSQTPPADDSDNKTSEDNQTQNLVNAVFSIDADASGPQNGPVGTEVTVVGSGFTATGNQVYFDDILIDNIPSDNGTSIVFEVPVEATNIGGGYPVVILNGNGATSDGFEFYLTASDDTPVTPVITDISGTADIGDLAAGLPGSLVTVTGTGFSTTNTVNFGGLAPITGIASANGTSLSFTVPNDAMTFTTYSVTITNDDDLTSNAVDFRVVDSQQQNTVRARVVITTFQNQNGGNVDDVIFLGSNSNTVAASEWFPVYENGQYFNDPNTSGYENVAGLAVRRNGDKVGVVLHGSHPTSGWREHVIGYVEFDGATVSCLESDIAGGNPLENGFNKIMAVNPGNDEAWVTGAPTNLAHFWVTVDTGDDGFYTEFDITNSGNQCEGINVIPEDEPETTIDLTYISESPAPVLTPINLHGHGFSTTSNNIVHFGQYDVTVTAYDGLNNSTLIDMVVPVQAAVGTYQVSVTNTVTGETSNTLPFVVEASDPNDLLIISLDPEQGPKNTVVTITSLGGFTANNIVHFEDTDIATTSINGTTLQFTVPNVSTGRYMVSVTNSNGTTSNELPFTVTSSGDNGDTNPPTTPVIVRSSHTVNATSTSNNVDIEWTVSVDDGSGLAGYSFVWDHDSNTAPDNTVDSQSTSTTQNLADGSWYFHIKALDNAGNVSGITHYGPIGIAHGGNGGGDDDDDDDDDNGGGNSSGSRRRGSTNPTPETVLPGVCTPLITEFIKFGANNNPVEVTKLQEFLISHESANITVTGIYDLATFEAVKAFQVKYASDILGPWGVDEATGYVFITTSLKINLLKCESDEKINLDLRNYYPNPGAPGQEIGLLDDGVNDDNIAQATTTDATSTTVAEATSTNVFQLAAAGVLDFLDIYPWWWWLLVIALIVIISWLLKKSDDDDQDGEEVTPQTGYLPLNTNS